MLRRKKGNFRFVGRKHSKKGILSVILGAAACVLLPLLAILASLGEGQRGLWLGGAAMAGFFLSGIGFYAAAASLKEKDIFYAAPVMGMVMNGGMFLSYMIVYSIGI